MTCPILSDEERKEWETIASKAEPYTDLDAYEGMDDPGMMFGFEDPETIKRNHERLLATLAHDFLAGKFDCPPKQTTKTDKIK